MGLSNVIWKFGLSRAFDGTVNGNTENRKYIEFTRYLLSFFSRGSQKGVFIKFGLQCTISSFQQLLSRT